ncbi:hypothetical protein D9M68_884570 [compost metagenome]
MPQRVQVSRFQVVPSPQLEQHAFGDGRQERARILDLGASAVLAELDEGLRRDVLRIAAIGQPPQQSAEQPCMVIAEDGFQIGQDGSRRHRS